MSAIDIVARTTQLIILFHILSQSDKNYHIILHYRKRAAAKRMIERYYYQLIDGCGRSECDNPVCASCQRFNYKDLTTNDAAIRAVELFRTKAKLCEPNSDAPNKMPRDAKDEGATSVLSSSAALSGTMAVPSTSTATSTSTKTCDSSFGK